MPYEKRITDDLDAILAALPPRVGAPLRERDDSHALLEVVLAAAFAALAGSGVSVTCKIRIKGHVGVSRVVMGAASPRHDATPCMTG